MKKKSMVMTGVMRRFSAALAAAAMAVSIVPFADISAYAGMRRHTQRDLFMLTALKVYVRREPYYYGGTNCYYLTYKSKE